MKTTHLLIPLICATFFSGCATVPPSELVNARAAYQQASTGEARQLVPADLHKAQEALKLAEHSFERKAKSQTTKDLAYVAQRRSEQAIALAATAAGKATQEKAEAEFRQYHAELVKQGKEDLKASELRTAEARAELERQAANQRRQAEMRAIQERTDAESQRQQAEIARVQQELIEAERRNAEAMEELAAIAALREEARGSIVTLAGGVLFRFGEATLIPTALTTLDQVAQALSAVKGRNIIVEGHTDSQGSAEYNQGLSERRAKAVRDYLVQKGVSAELIRTSGKGEDHPIADNASPEGRANNRRVELVIER